MENNEKRLVQVCDNCGRACCWHGDFFCDEYKNAGLKLKTVKALNQSKLEHASHYSTDVMEKVYGESAPFGFSSQEQS